MIDWFKKHRVLFALICVVILLLLMGIPFVINILFKINTTTDIFVAEWSAGDALGYYGAILSFLGTVVLGALSRLKTCLPAITSCATRRTTTTLPAQMRRSLWVRVRRLRIAQSPSTQAAAAAAWIP